MLADGKKTYLCGPSAAPSSAQDDRLAQYQTAMQYFGADGLGSVRQLYDATGQVLATNRYDPYGIKGYRLPVTRLQVTTRDDPV